MTFNQWLLSERGRRANNIHTLAEQMYLTNRLMAAYEAGASHGVVSHDQMQKTIEWYEKKLRKSKRRILDLEKELQIKTP